MRHLIRYLLILTVISFYPQPVWAQFDKIFTTQYAKIYYVQDSDIDDFIWRLGGQKLEFLNNQQVAVHRIDRIINRVQMILDMWPADFSIHIYLHRGPLKNNKVAYHDYASKSLHINVDYASDGVVAHEIAHAVIDQYFSTPPPRKMQEILAQYVDQHLWSDY